MQTKDTSAILGFGDTTNPIDRLRGEAKDFEGSVHQTVSEVANTPEFLDIQVDVERESAQQSAEIPIKLKVTYQDSIFSRFFNQRDVCLSVYKELNPDDMTVTLEDITICTLDNVLTTGIYNDAAFLVNNRMIILLEHQSTINRNMPVRCLLYLAEEYQRWFGLSSLGIDGDGVAKEQIDTLKKARNLYKNSQVDLPCPEFYVIYTGSQSWNVDELRLSDAFKHSGIKSSLELVVKILKGTGRDSTMPPNGELQEYTLFIKRYKGMLESNISPESAVNTAIKKCKSVKLKAFLESKLTEVIDMLSNERSLELRDAAILEEGIEKGIEKGMEKGIEKGIEKGMEKGMEKGREEGLKTERIVTIKRLLGKGKSAEQIADLLDMELSYVEQVQKL